MQGACGAPSTQIGDPKGFFIASDVNKTITITQKWGAYDVSVAEEFGPRSYNLIPPGAAIINTDVGKTITIVNGTITVDGDVRQAWWPGGADPNISIVDAGVTITAVATTTGTTPLDIGGIITLSKGDPFENPPRTSIQDTVNNPIVVTPSPPNPLNLTATVTSVEERPSGDVIVTASDGAVYTVTNPSCYDADMRLKNFGHAWHWPYHVDDTTGLGGGLAWAWDTDLCDKILPLFRENLEAITFIDCEQLRLAVQRAMDSWAKNHRMINFLEVTDQCEHEREANITAPLPPLPPLPHLPHPSNPPSPPTSQPPTPPMPHLVKRLSLAHPPPPPPTHPTPQSVPLCFPSPSRFHTDASFCFRSIPAAATRAR